MKRFAIFLLTALLFCGGEAAWAANTPPAMIVPGQFNVSSTGAATYTIPISVPPGSAGMVPALSLGYSSQSGDGIEGLGWTLSGLPSISRCPRTLDQDGVHGSVNYDANDKLCMEGQRLINVSGVYGTDGAVYHTEIESFSKIVEHNAINASNAWFEVWTKSGQHMQFGNSTDSQILTTDAITRMPTSIIRAWAVNKISDTVGNYLTVTYNCAPIVSSACSDSDRTTYGEAYPLEIDYTGNAAAGVSPYNSVRFVYQCQDATSPCRLDSVPMYQAGALTQTTVLLTDIKTYQGANVVYDYQLAYRAGTLVTHSRLTSVTLCDPHGICLAPTTFGWQGGLGYLTMGDTSETVAQGQMIGAGDFLGNGLTDIVPISSNYTPCPSTFPVYNGPSFSTSTTSFPNPLAGASSCAFKPLVETVLAPNGVANILLQSTGGTSASLMLLNTDGSPLGSYVITYTNSPAFAGDLNGDGVPDAFVQGLTSHYFLASPGGGFGSATSDGSYPVTTTATGGGDFDGDGCIDVFANGAVNSIDYNPTGYCNPAVSTSTPPTASGYVPILGDFNGDGKTDILLVSQSGAAELWLSTGTGFYEVPGTSLPSDWGKYAIEVGDWNGDGKADLLLIASGASGFYGSGTPHQLWLSTGTGFVQALDSSNNPITIANSAATASATAADWNNDGATDFWLQQPTAVGGDQLYTFAYVPELMITISNGIGSTTNVSYTPLNANGAFYTKGTTGSYPIQDVDGALYVVGRVDASNGLGTCNPSVSYVPCYSSGYAYAGAQIDLTGRGFLGFGKIWITDLQTNIVQETDYRTDFPFVGMIRKQIKHYNPNVNNLNSVTNTYVDDGSCWSSTVPPSGVYQVCLTQSVTSGYDLNDTAAFPTTTTSYTYDDYGNALTVNVAVSDGSSKNTTNTYNNDTANWYLGRLLSTSVTSTVGALISTRQSSFAYDASTGLLTEEAIEPGVYACNSGFSSCQVTTSYTYDLFGHRVSTTIFGSGITTRVSQAFYDSNGEFQIGAENALAQTESWSYDPRFGTPVTHTGPNFVATNWSYDTLGRLAKEVRPDGTQTLHSYAYCSGCIANSQFYAVTRIVAPNGVTQIGPSSTSYYDMLSRDIADDTQGFDGSNIRVATGYDGNGRVQQRSRPYFTGSASPVWTSFAYDALGRVTQATFPDSSQTNYGFNGLVTSVTNSLSQTTTTTKNAQGLNASVEDALGHTTTYVYDPFGNPVKITDPAGNVVSNSYDYRGNKVVSSDPDMGLWFYTYDVLGELVKQIDGNNQNTYLTYDVLGRPTSRSENNLYSSWTYGITASQHNIGKIIEAKACTSVSCTRVTSDRRYSYDGLTRPSKTTLQTPDNSYAYSETYNARNGQLALTTYPSGFVLNHTYNQYGYLCRLTDYLNDVPTCSSAGVGTTSFVTINSRDAELHLTSSTAGNGIVTTQAFNPLTGLIENTNAGPSSSVAQFAYAFDTIGNLTARTDYDEGYTETFCYDALNRLTSYDIPSACPGGKTVSYDDIGNITSKSDTGTYNYPSSGSPRPHAVSSISGTVDGLVNPQYTYDGNGSLTCTSTGGDCTGTVGRRIVMTGFNMPASITQGADFTYFAYDDQHQRVSQVSDVSGSTTATTYVNDPSSGAMSEYVVNGPTTATTWNGFNWAGSLWGGTLASGQPTFVDYITLDGQIIAQRKTQYGLNTWASVNWGAFQWGANLNPLTQWGSFAWGSVPWYANGFTISIWNASNWAAQDWSGFASSTTQYFVLDHLGSVAVITDSSGNVVERQSYDAWGKQRNPNGTDSPCGTLGSQSTRGYINQEQMPTQCLVNLNARLYDPSIGKFMAADPMVGDPMMPNAFNRYAYVLNNPLSLEDPSGLCFLGCFWNTSIFRAAIGIVAAVTLQEWVLPELELGEVSVSAFAEIGVSGSQAASLLGYGLLNAGISGGVAGAITSGNLKGALLGTLQAGLFYGAGDLLQSEGSSSIFGGHSVDAFVAHGLVGGVTSVIGGGNFGSGFLAGGIGSLGENPALDTGYFEANIVENAVLGGVGSELGGGKFANGAETGAFGYLFNYLLHGRDFTAKEGQNIADDAASWKGTPYVTGGDTRAGADCSWSTYCIFDESGYPYGYEDSRQFENAAVNNSKFPFRMLDSNETPQPGDVILFPGHMAIYAGDGLMWTATHPGGAPYLEQQMKYWPTPTGYFRPQVPTSGAH